MKKTEYRDITGDEAYKLLTLGAEAESLESEDKWRRYKIKLIKSTLKDASPSGKLMHYKKGDWRESPLEFSAIINREWRTVRKLAEVTFVAIIKKSPENGENDFVSELPLNLSNFPEGARVQVVMKELPEYLRQ
jgi:hypothetical protein